MIRVDPTTGAGLPNNPLAGSSDPNARRIVAYGLRNPFRFTFRPGTSEIWLGDVGWNDWEEIDRIVSPDGRTSTNFGWPCYEGIDRQPGYDAANLNICENLYAAPNVDTKPYFAYHHTSQGRARREAVPTRQLVDLRARIRVRAAGRQLPGANTRARSSSPTIRASASG